MYVDPSRVEMLVAYSRLASAGAEAERVEREAEVRLFIESIWAEASAEGRARFMDAARGIAVPMPWAAVMVPKSGDQAAVVDDAEGRPTLRGPAALELIVGQADPDDEGVAGYRIDPASEAGRQAVAALMGWDLITLAAITSAPGWRLDRLDEGPRPATDDEALGDDEGVGVGVGDGVDADAGAGGAAMVGQSADASSESRWPWGIVIGGLGIAAAIGLAIRERERSE